MDTLIKILALIVSIIFVILSFFPFVVGIFFHVGKFNNILLELSMKALISIIFISSCFCVIISFVNLLKQKEYTRKLLLCLGVITIIGILAFVMYAIGINSGNIKVNLILG